MRNWLRAIGILVLLGMTMVSLSCDEDKRTVNELQRVTSGSPTAKAGPPLPDLSIDSVQMVYRYQYKGQQPVTALSVPFNGSVRTDINWMPKNPYPEFYGTSVVFTLSNKGNVDWQSPDGGRIDVYVDNFTKTWTAINLHLPDNRLKAGETFKYINDNIKGADIVWAIGTKNYLFDFYNKGNELDKENNKYKSTVTFYLKTD